MPTSRFITTALGLPFLWMASCGENISGEPDTTTDGHSETTGTNEESTQADTGSAEDTSGEPLVFPEDPGETGPCSFDKLNLKVPSSEANYKIDLILFAPRIEGQLAPAVVINHGNQISGNMYTNIAEHLASWCYVAAINDYASALVPATPPEKTVRDTMDVLKFVLEAQDPSLEGVVRPTGGAVVGHSKGGAMGLWAAAQNPQLIDAVVGLDPVHGHGAIENPEVFQEIAVPTLLIGELFSASHSIGGQACAPATSNFQQFYSLIPEGLQTLEITFAQAMHMSWLNAPKGCGIACAACPDNPQADHEEVRSRSRRYVTAWLERYLRNHVEVEAYLFGDAIADDVASGAITTRSK